MTGPDDAPDAIPEPSPEPDNRRQSGPSPARHANVDATPANVLDVRGRIERPSTRHDPTAEQETLQWPSEHAPRRHDTDRATRVRRRGDPGAAARDAPVRLLPPDYVPLEPEQRAEAVRALTEMILSWMQRTGRAVPPDPRQADESDRTDLDEAA